MCQHEAKSSQASPTPRFLPNYIYLTSYLVYKYLFYKEEHNGRLK